MWPLRWNIQFDTSLAICEYHIIYGLSQIALVSRSIRLFIEGCSVLRLHSLHDPGRFFDWIGFIRFSCCRGPTEISQFPNYSFLILYSRFEVIQSGWCHHEYELFLNSTASIKKLFICRGLALICMLDLLSNKLALFSGHLGWPLESWRTPAKENLSSTTFCKVVGPEIETHVEEADPSSEESTTGTDEVAEVSSMLPHNGFDSGSSTQHGVSTATQAAWARAIRLIVSEGHKIGDISEKKCDDN